MGVVMVPEMTIKGRRVGSERKFGVLGSSVQGGNVGQKRLGGDVVSFHPRFPLHLFSETRRFRGIIHAE